MPQFATADLCDQYPNEVQIVAPGFFSYGGLPAFAGQMMTVKVFEDNSLVRAALGEDGTGKVLVVDGGGSLRCALVGDNLAAMGQQHGWQGIVVYGCIRDAQPISQIAIGLRALGTHPMKSIKQGVGQRDVAVTFSGVRFVPGHFLYADADGIIVAAHDLLADG
ncbi:MAG: ribonuclease E activity regulator RraA [Chloroflexaceae bacterium]|nr:ribonuclease E activity regulator RraA [Chloroflexaceae bacterium]NJO04650.1 ribonuclease E activity regulator RraA [Chloroflexaceae bacterium]